MKLLYRSTLAAVFVGIVVIATIPASAAANNQPKHHVQAVAPAPQLQTFRGADSPKSFAARYVAPPAPVVAPTPPPAPVTTTTAPVTTTTVPAPVAPTPVVAAVAPQSNQSIWDCIIAHESGGNPAAVNPSSGAGGLFQFLPSSWIGYGGGQFAPLPEQATAAQQWQIAIAAQAQSGWYPWVGDGCTPVG